MIDKLTTADRLRLTIQQALSECDGLCLDAPVDRAVLAGLLLGRLRPLLELFDPCDTGARLEAEYHQRAAEEAQPYENRDNLLDEWGDLVNACRDFSNAHYQPEFPHIRGILDPAVDPDDVRRFNLAWEQSDRSLKELSATGAGARR